MISLPGMSWRGHARRDNASSVAREVVKAISSFNSVLAGRMNSTSPNSFPICPPLPLHHLRKPSQSSVMLSPNGTMLPFLLLIHTLPLATLCLAISIMSAITVLAVGSLPAPFRRTWPPYGVPADNNGVEHILNTGERVVFTYNSR